MAENPTKGEAWRRSINPDRVDIDHHVDVEKIVTEHPPRTIEGTVPYQLPNRYGVEFDPIVRPGAAKLAGLLGLMGTIGVNMGVEYRSGSQNEKLNDPKIIEHILKTIDAETFARAVEEQVCSTIDAAFMHRFSTRDEHGTEAFNPGGFIIPFAISLSEQCRAKVDVEIHIPYHFARTFTEVASKNPQSREHLVTKLADFIRQEAHNQLVVRGVAGVTETTLVLNRQENILEVQSGKPKVDFGKFDVEQITLLGTSSAEAEASSMHQKSESLQGFNPENLQLAQQRLKEFMPLLKPALEKAGVDLKVLEQAQSYTYEHNLVENEIKELADAADAILGGSIQGTDAARAYALIEEYNSNNQAIRDTLEQNPQYAQLIKKHIENQRGVRIEMRVDTEYNRETVHPIVLPLPLFLLLFGGVRITKVPGQIVHIPVKSSEYVPDTVSYVEHDIFNPVKRRLFSETTPADMSEERSFHDVYDSIDLSERARDTHALLEHMLLEEILPSLDPETEEPMINYDAIANAGREFLVSDERRFAVQKGRYETSKEAELHMTNQLLEMWEQHDAHFYPMEGIDVQSVLNYRHSDKVVFWAKTLAHCFVRLIKETTTTDEFRERLSAEILKAQRNRTITGGSDRNMFVQSQV